MPQYLVDVREVWVSTVGVEAVNEEEAIRRVGDCEGVELNREYSHTLSVDNWAVEELDEQDELEEIRKNSG